MRIWPKGSRDPIARKMHRDRLRQVMLKAESRGAILPKREKGPSVTPATVDLVAHASKKNKGRHSSQSNKIKSLKLSVKIVTWYTAHYRHDKVVRCGSWYGPAAATGFEGYADDKERQDLSHYFYAAILGNLPDNAEYYLDDCLRVDPSKRNHNAGISGGQEGPRQSVEPCVLNAGHKGECTSIQPKRVPGSTIGEFLKDESGKELADQLYRDPYSRDCAKVGAAIPVRGALDEARDPMNRDTARVKVVYLYLRNHYERCSGGLARNNQAYERARAVLATFLKPPKEEEAAEEEPKLSTKRDDHPRDPQEDPDDPEDQSKRHKGEGREDKDSTRKGSTGAKKRATTSWSGASGYNKRSRNATGQGSMSSSAVRTVTALALLPILASGTQLAAIGPAATALSASSVLLSATYYAAGFTTTWSIIKAVPEVVEVAQEGVEQIIRESVEGSKSVIRSVTLSFVVIAAIVMVALCYYALDQFAHLQIPYCGKRHRRFPTDNWTRSYGGRLRGGSRDQSSEQISVEEATGTQAEFQVNPGEVDVERLRKGDVFSFIYARGTRVGLRRTVTLRNYVFTNHGIKMYCEEPGIFATDVKTYWIHLTSQAEYYGNPGQPLAILDNAGGTGRNLNRQGSAESTAIARALAADAPSPPQESTVTGGLGLSSGSEASGFCPRRSTIAVEFPPPSVQFKPEPEQVGTPHPRAGYGTSSRSERVRGNARPGMGEPAPASEEVASSSSTVVLRGDQGQFAGLYGKSELGLADLAPVIQESQRRAFFQEENQRLVGSGNSRLRSNSADSAIPVRTQVERTKVKLSEQGVLGQDWKASKSWRERDSGAVHQITN